jgi:hypothetical protein
VGGSSMRSSGKRRRTWIASVTLVTFSSGVSSDPPMKPDARRRIYQTKVSTTLSYYSSRDRARGAEVSDVFHFDGDHHPVPRPGPARSVLRLVRLVQRSRRQSMGSSTLWRVRADRSETPLVLLVRRLRGCARAREDSRRGSQECNPPHRRRARRSGVRVHMRPTLFPALSFLTTNLRIISIENMAMRYPVRIRNGVLRTEGAGPCRTRPNASRPRRK